MPTTHSGDNARERSRAMAATVTTATRPGGGWPDRSRASTNPAHHRHVAEVISNPLGLTTAPRKYVIGVIATSSPTRRNRLRDHAAMENAARARKTALRRALVSRMA